eukprot:g10583.t1
MLLVLNVGMSNTAVMSILVPIIEKWAVEVNLSKNLFLMPLSYVLLISGTIAIFATSSNLIAQGLMQDAGQRPFGTFEIAPVERLGQRVNFEHPAFTFQYYDIVALYTTATQIVSLHKNPGLNLLCRDMGDPVINRLADAMEITEIVLDVACPLIGQKMCDESNVRKLYAAKVLAVRPLSLLESLRGAVSNVWRDQVVSG